jgi:CelD/BcsL family acetyltransferase involved in cellulose biosynthesis
LSTLLDAPPPVRAAADEAHPLAVEEVSTADGLRALRPEWETLWGASPRATPFQHPAWLIAWWTWLGGDDLRTLVLRDPGSGRMIGIFPVFVWPGDGPRQLTPVGNGISDHVDLLAAPGCEARVADAILAHLAESRGSWDTADFRDLPADSALLRASIPRGIRAWVEDDVACPVLHLPKTIDHLPDAVPAAFLKKVRYYTRRLERDLAAEYVSADDEAGAAEMMDALERLHAARWAERGGGVLEDERVRGFHREVAAAFVRRGVLRLFSLSLDGETAAVWYGFGAKGCVHYYLGGFDPALERYSPGTVMVGHAISRAVEEGAAEFDFLRGGEAYKYAWGAVDRPQRRMRIEVTDRGG